MQRRARTKTSPPPSSAAGGAWIFDAATGCARLSAGARRLVGVKAGELVGDLVDGLPLDEASRIEARAAIAACVAGGGDFDLKLRCAEGHDLAALRLTGGAVADEDGVLRRLVGVVCDATEAARLAEEVAERAAHLHSILETAQEGMVVIDPAGQMHSFSRAAERMFGYSEAEAIGQNVNMLMGEPDHSRHDGYLARYLETAEPRIIGIGRIVSGRRKDGSQFPLHLSVGETNVDGRRLFTGFMHDLTEERRSESLAQQLQSELAHISRLSALGEMGSALAHELNQPLAAIGNYITGSRRLLAEMPGPGAARVAGALEKAAEQVLRAGQIIRRLRDFVSRRPSERRVESVAKLVEEASALGLVGAREKRVTLRYKLAPECDDIFVDRIQIEQVLVNLLRNGLDSMECASRRELIVSSRLVSRGVLEIAVSDSGAGISAQALARLFEPFFTTKPAGLGVGLSISRGIVEAHGGDMHAENNEHGGATFRFTLPLARKGEAGKGEASKAEAGKSKA
ncbi:MAG TPA: PAS domain S-box protein [Roseiarcus sp.]|nr:PAS domain S-box protein [Roseiarcus sp.]